MRPGRIHLGLLALLLLAGAGFAGCGPAPEKVGETRTAGIETPHPYPRAANPAEPVWTHTIRQEGATFIKVHFERLELADSGAGADRLRLLDADGDEVSSFEGSGPADGGAFWAPAVDGPEVTLELMAPVGGAFGFRIDQYGVGDPIPAD